MDGFHRGHPFPYRHPAENADTPLTEQELARLVTRVTGVPFDEETIVKTAEQTNATDAVMQDPLLKSQIEKKNRALLRNTLTPALALVAFTAFVISRVNSGGSLWWMPLLITSFLITLFLQWRAVEKGNALGRRHIAEALRRTARVPAGYFLKNRLKERIASLHGRLLQEDGAISILHTSLFAQQQMRTRTLILTRNVGDISSSHMSE